MKKITICGSLKFQREMMEIALQLELEGNCVFTPVFSINGNKDDFTEEQFEILKKMHQEKIKLSDAILVVNVNNYIGSSTKREIEFAQSLNKEVMYYTHFVKNKE